MLRKKHKQRNCQSKRVKVKNIDLKHYFKSNLFHVS